VLFDIVVHDPHSADAASNVSLLDMAAGHFSRIEFRSKESVPGSLISEFAHIARNYINDVSSGRERQISTTERTGRPSSALQNRSSVDAASGISPTYPSDASSIINRLFSLSC
jgi:hypothetical protein